MTPEERDRLVRVETIVGEHSKHLAAANEKLDRLVAAANMGKGAWWLLLKIGAVLVALATAGAWIVNTAMWAYDKLSH